MKAARFMMLCCAFALPGCYQSTTHLVDAARPLDSGYLDVLARDAGSASDAQVDAGAPVWDRRPPEAPPPRGSLYWLATDLWAGSAHLVETGLDGESRARIEILPPGSAPERTALGFDVALDGRIVVRVRDGAEPMPMASHEFTRITRGEPDRIEVFILPASVRERERHAEDTWAVSEDGESVFLSDRAAGLLRYDFESGDVVGATDPGCPLLGEIRRRPDGTIWLARDCVYDPETLQVLSRRPVPEEIRSLEPLALLGDGSFVGWSDADELAIAGADGRVAARMTVPRFGTTVALAVGRNDEIAWSELVSATYPYVGRVDIFDSMAATRGSVTPLPGDVLAVALADPALAQE